jgi:predicted RNase H-like HicB family nuclease
VYCYFPAVFDPHEDGSGRYDVTFADLPGCVSQGKDFGDALCMAGKALTLHLASMLADGECIPEPSSLEAARQADEAEALAEGIALAPETLWQYVGVEVTPHKPKAESPVRLSISLKPSIIEKIDYAAEELGLSRSGVINAAAREYISRMYG